MAIAGTVYSTRVVGREAGSRTAPPRPREFAAGRHRALALYSVELLRAWGS
jgi:hypothetical protein